MRILHIVPGLDDPTCGIAVAAKMVARRQSRDGDAVECVGFRDWTKAQIREVDEVWVHSMWTPGVMMAAWTALRMGKKLVRMPHGCMDPVKVRHHWWKKMWVAPIERWLFKRADSVIATCDDEANWVRYFVPGEKNVEMLSLGECVDFSRVECVERVDAREKLRLLFVGRLHPLKGVEYLIEAMGEVLTRIPRRPQGGVVKDDALAGVSSRDEEVDESGLRDLVLKIIGKDEGEGEKLRQLVRDLGVDVEFCGVVSGEEKERAWKWCDVLVLPTLSENYGLVVAEALERGKRVITTDGAPVWECLEGGSQELGFSVGYGGRLIYLKGYRDGGADKRIELLKKAIAAVSRDVMIKSLQGV